MEQFHNKLDAFEFSYTHRYYYLLFIRQYQHVYYMMHDIANMGRQATFIQEIHYDFDRIYQIAKLLALELEICRKTTQRSSLFYYNGYIW